MVTAEINHNEEVKAGQAFYKPPQGLDSTEIRVRKFIESEYNITLLDYDALHKFSCESYPEFWETIVKYFGIKFGGKYEQVIDKTKTIAEFPKWFEGATVNYTENILRGRDEDVAFITTVGKQRTYTYGMLKNDVHTLATSLRNMGVTPGDKICGFLPNAYETAVAMYATASIGATWSSSSVENGVVAVLSRFQQVKPKVLFTVEAVTYKGKLFNLSSTIDQIVDGLPSLEKVIVMNNLADTTIDVSGFKSSENFVDFKAFSDLGKNIPTPFQYERVPFAHPLFIMFSSGTTGLPKAIVHTYGGTLLKHVEEHMVQGDSRPNDRMLFYTTCGWMMWNWLMSFPFCGGSIVLYDECPTVPDEHILLKIAAQQKCTILGSGAGIYEIFRRNGQDFKSLYDLTNLRLVYSTASPLTHNQFVFINDHISPGAVISSISGGTDIIGCFMGGTLSKPVVAGECTALFLGMDIHCFDQNGKEVFDQKGELVCTTPFPSMPLHFLGDEGNKRYKKSYFEKFDGVWAHEDFCYISSTTGGVVMVGRSDSTLNRGGVRIGTAELYQVVETFDEVTDSVVVGKTVRQENGEECADEHIILFVQLKEGVELTDELKKKICLKLRSMQSPRHMPNEIFAIADIPYTNSGKKVELAVKKIVNGEVVEKSSSIRNPDSLDLYYPFA